MQDLQNNAKKEFEGILAHLTNDLTSLHTSRATPILVENILVNSYGTKVPLKHVASLSTPDARTIIVQPWDISALGDIQKAIADSHVGLSSAVDEKSVRLTMPQMSEERRREIIKELGKKIEEARISVRRVRDHAQKMLEEAGRAKEISEDEKYRSKQVIQKLVDEYNKKIGGLEEKKTREIQGI